MSRFDVVVIGGGIVGSWTALHLKRQGKNVLQLEQFGSPHTRGSSHGQTRIIRSAYAERYFALLMPEAVRLWKEVEQQAQQKLFEQCGCLCIANTPEAQVEYDEGLLNMAEFCPEGLEKDDSKAESFFARHLQYGPDKRVFLDNSGGVLFAHRSVLAIQRLFQDVGGHFWDNCRVSRIDPSDSEVRLETSRGEVVATSVVVCAGTWTRQLLVPHFFESLPLQPEVVYVYYWKEKEEGVYSSASGFPCVLDMSCPNVYSVPSAEYPGLMKVCIHGGIPCDPDNRDRTPPDQKMVDKLKRFVKQHFPLLESEPSIVETCMYTVTPDEAFVVDVVPGHKNIVIGAGFSGTGFKTSPTIGKLLSELATGQEPSLDISAFRLSRFTD